MKNLFPYFVALLAVCFLLTGCGGETLPEGMEEKALLAAGREITLQLVDGKYDDVHAVLREDVRGSTTPQAIRDLVLEQTKDAGIYKQIEDTMVTGQTVDGEKVGIAVLYCEYDEDDILFRLAFDARLQLVGLSVQRQ